MKHYFLVEAEVTEHAPLEVHEIQTQLAECAQSDEEIGFVGFRVWPVTDPVFESRYHGTLYRDVEMFSDVDPLEHVAVSLMVRVNS